MKKVLYFSVLLFVSGVSAIDSAEFAQLDQPEKSNLLNLFHEFDISDHNKQKTMFACACLKDRRFLFSRFDLQQRLNYFDKLYRSERVNFFLKMDCDDQRYFFTKLNQNEQMDLFFAFNPLYYPQQHKDFFTLLCPQNKRNYYTSFGMFKGGQQLQKDFFLSLDRGNQMDLFDALDLKELFSLSIMLNPQQLLDLFGLPSDQHQKALDLLRLLGKYATQQLHNLFNILDVREQPLFLSALDPQSQLKLFASFGQNDQRLLFNRLDTQQKLIHIDWFRAQQQPDFFLQLDQRDQPDLLAKLEVNYQLTLFFQLERPNQLSFFAQLDPQNKVNFFSHLGQQLQLNFFFELDRDEQFSSFYLLDQKNKLDLFNLLDPQSNRDSFNRLEPELLMNDYLRKYCFSRFFTNLSRKDQFDLFLGLNRSSQQNLLTYILDDKERRDFFLGLDAQNQLVLFNLVKKCQRDLFFMLDMQNQLNLLAKLSRQQQDDLSLKFDESDLKYLTFIRLDKHEWNNFFLNLGGRDNEGRYLGGRDNEGRSNRYLLLRNLSNNLQDQLNLFLQLEPQQRQNFFLALLCGCGWVRALFDNLCFNDRMDLFLGANYYTRTDMLLRCCNLEELYEELKELSEELKAPIYVFCSAFDQELSERQRGIFQNILTKLMNQRNNQH
ncbi:MAG: hypothetical protein LBB21_04560 [Holosporaceae bacterium]|jgi:Mg/Co/Ni transporter MgtE|nr:hypothetical protein [Holosporaceae bacterium]